MLIICSVLYYSRDFLPAGVGHQGAANLEPPKSDTEIVGRLLGQLVYKYTRE